MCAEAFCIQQYLCEGLSLPLTSGSLTTLWSYTVWSLGSKGVDSRHMESDSHHVFDYALLDSKKKKKDNSLYLIFDFHTGDLNLDFGLMA